MIKKFLKWARISAAGDDTTQFPVQQIEFKGKTADCFILFPYGLHGNVAKDALALVFSMEGDDSNRAAIAGTPTNRPEMAEGELCVYHPPTNSIIHFKSNGDIDINSDTKLNVTAPEVAVNGNLTISGDLTVQGATALSATVTSNGKDISDTHTHVGSPTAPTGGISPTGVPI